MKGFNIVDGLIVVVLILYIGTHVKRGALALSQNLLGFVGGIVLAFLTYHTLSVFVSKYLDFPPGLTDALSFVVLFIILEALLERIIGAILGLLPIKLYESWFSRVLAVVPAAIDGLILISLTLLLLVIAPIFSEVKTPIENSKIASVLLKQATGLENYVDKIFGKAAEESLGFLTVKPGEGESVKLPYSPRTLTIDEEAEKKMLLLINIERGKVGAKALVMDPKIVLVARAHSKDMWVRQFFAHINPDGASPFDRMEAGGVSFFSAGENLALARNVERAHDGLMNSPGHKRNILDPTFGRVGIGVIDGGIYGQMFTQNFAN